MPVIDVPAHIQLQDRIANQVETKGGTNWDLTRGTIATPITAYKEEAVKRSPYAMGPKPSSILDRTPYTVHHEMPVGRDPDRTVYFDKNKEEVTIDAKSLLRTMPKGASVIVAGHADAREQNTPTIAEARANIVADFLKENGFKVEKVKSFGATVQLSEEGRYAEVNRRVEVFIR